MRTQTAVERASVRDPRPPVRKRLEVRGRVQGVGFRPFAWRLARELGLSGVVGNSLQGAFLEVQGPVEAVDTLILRLERELPEPGRVASIEATGLPLSPADGFRILASASSGPATAEVTPDLDVCPDCLRELFDPSDRRHRYPFLNCTRCGPRYSVVLGLPYDRASTTLKDFPLCPRCRAEYEDPADRRFHAQPGACPDCGPRLWAADPAGAELSGDPVGLAADALRAGSVVALKGVGGFHLCCRADDPRAVARLRGAKDREAKPFAVMVADLATARSLADLDRACEAALISPAKPIVLAPKLPGAGLAEGVAPDTGSWGVMLPGTPLHHLLLDAVRLPLVMTSGNLSGEPLCADNGEALERLGGVADLFLLHDRPIARRLDDSVLASLDDGGGGRVLAPLRRARGFVPSPLALPLPAREPILAVGGDLKSAVCVAEGGRAVLSEHLGDLEHPSAFRNFGAAAERLQGLLRARAARLAADPHPLYVSTRWARSLGLPLTLVQHHHAHAASCMAENGLRGPVAAIVCDGTGYGTDGGVWGGEILVCDLKGFRRAAHLSPFPLPGGDSAGRETWRPALGALSAAWGADWRSHLGVLERLAEGRTLALAARRLEAGVPAPASTSLGRLFDAAAALLGLRGRNRFEADAAMALQHAAESAPSAGPLPFSLLPPSRGDGPWIMDARPMVRALCRGGEAPALARAFHEGVAGLLVAGAASAASAAGVDAVVLSGGCFANSLLLGLVCAGLRGRGLRPYTHRSVPCGDGGLALGQAAVAAASGADLPD